MVHFGQSDQALAPKNNPYIPSSHRLTLNPKQWCRIVKVNHPSDLATPWCSAPFRAHTTVLWRCRRGARQRKQLRPRRNQARLWTPQDLTLWNQPRRRPSVVSFAAIDKQASELNNFHSLHNLARCVPRGLAWGGGTSPCPPPIPPTGIGKHRAGNRNGQNRNTQTPIQAVNKPCINRRAPCSTPPRRAVGNLPTPPRVVDTAPNQRPAWPWTASSPGGG